MATVTIYGASDDLIELDGAIREEFTCYDEDEPTYLAFSDGTVLSVLYDGQGMWRVNRVAEGSATYAKREATDPDDDYSDRVTLAGDLAWCVYGKNYTRAEHASSSAAVTGEDPS